MAKLHLRRWHTDETWCGQPARRSTLARTTTPSNRICPRCVRLEEQDNIQFKRDAELIAEALWRAGFPLL